MKKLGIHTCKGRKDADRLQVSKIEITFSWDVQKMLLSYMEFQVNRRVMGF